MKEVYGYLIKNKKPAVGEVIRKIFAKENIDTIVFASYPEFEFAQNFDDDYLVFLDKKKKNVDPFGVAWKYADIEQIIEQIKWMTNLVYCFSEPVNECDLQFRKNKWNFIYHCVDRYAVELFTTNHELKNGIVNHFEIQEIEYPGQIFGPSGWSALR